MQRAMNAVKLQQLARAAQHDLPVETSLPAWLALTPNLSATHKPQGISISGFPAALYRGLLLGVWCGPCAIHLSDYAAGS
jgi:hypothetical protein